MHEIAMRRGVIGSGHDELSSAIPGKDHINQAPATAFGVGDHHDTSDGIVAMNRW
jgi:hypothetical protein